jgi:hypothetical protein
LRPWRVLVGLSLFHSRKRNPTDGGNDMNRTIEKTEAELLTLFAEAARAINFWQGEQKQVIAALARMRAPVPTP